MRGGDGDDFLYGGDGNDWIKGDFGSDFLKGGQGQDKFVFFEMESATDTIADFEIGVDKILISQTLLSQSGQTVSSLLNGASFDGTDGLIQIGDLSIKLIGVDPDNMSSSDFSII